MGKNKSHAYAASVVFPVSNTHMTLALTDFFVHEDGILANVRADIERVPAMQADQRLDRIINVLPSRSAMVCNIRLMLAMFARDLKNHGGGRLSVSDDKVFFNMPEGEGEISIDQLTERVVNLLRDSRNWELHRTRVERPFSWTAILDIELSII
jgi:hypothetical protein